MYIGIALGHPTAFASEEWCTVPFEQQAKRPFDRLVDILLQLPGTHLLRNEMRSARQNNDDDYEKICQRVVDKADQLSSRMAGFWDEYGQMLSPDYQHARYHETSDFQADAEDWVLEETSPPNFDDPFAASIIALHSAGNILANALTWEATSDDPFLNKQAIVIYAESILSAVTYHERTGTSSGGTLAMIFPMKTVCRVTPCADQRRRAGAALQRWGERRGIDGLTRVMLPEKESIYNKIREMEEEKERTRFVGHW